MAARVCGSCWLALPVSKHSCPVCGGSTLRDETLVQPSDVEWKARVQELLDVKAAEEEGEGEMGKMRMNRTSRLLDIGIPLEQAYELASARSLDGGFAVDIHRLEDMVKRGCPLVTGIRIVAPLEPAVG